MEQQSKTPLDAERELMHLSTRIKLGELSRHERETRVRYSELLASVASADSASNREVVANRRKLEALYAGVKDLRVVNSPLHTGLEHVGGLIEFARCDPWGTRQAMALSQRDIRREVEQRRTLWHHNKLLGNLMLETLETTVDDFEQVAAVADAPGATQDEVMKVSKMTREETRRRLDNYFFNPSGIDEDEVYSYLENEVFTPRTDMSTMRKQRQLDELTRARKQLGEFCKELLTSPVNEKHVKHTVQSLLRSKAALAPDVVALLTNARNSSTVQEELSHVLTIEVSKLGEFSWAERAPNGVRVELERGMNGRYRCLFREDALTLLLFQYLGIRLAEKIKVVLSQLLQSLLDPDDEVLDSRSSVESERRSMIKNFMLFALPSSMAAAGDDPYADDSDDDDSDDGTKNDEPMMDKQDILRRVCAEAHLEHLTHTGKDDSISVLMTDFQFFGPSVAHEAVFATLRFLGITDELLAVFREYLHIPLAFPTDKDEMAPIRRIVRGIPVMRMISVVLAETVLFTMDYAVLASTGVFVYRSLDDIFLYDVNAEKVSQAWREMQCFIKRTGLKFNREKSGSMRLSVGGSNSSDEIGSIVDSPDYDPLPAASIRWALLEVQPDASVKIRQDRVTAHAVEMAERLRAAEARSVLAWVNVYNKFVNFFLRHFGKPSPVFGMRHFNEVIETLDRIHTLVFPATNGDVLASLAALIARRQRVDGDDPEKSDPSISASWAHWPMALGGLGLLNPYLMSWCARGGLDNHVKEFHSDGYLSPVGVDMKTYLTQADRPWPQPFTTVINDLQQQYDAFADRVQQSGGISESFSVSNYSKFFALAKSSTVTDRARKYGCVRHTVDKTFSIRSFEEFLLLVPMTDQQKVDREFCALLREGEQCKPSTPKYPAEKAAKKAFKDVKATSEYWKWVANVYGAQAVDEFGTVRFCPRELLPKQLIDTLKKEGISWSSSGDDLEGSS